MGQQNRLAAAQRQARHGILVAHPARQSEGVGQGVGAVGIVPEAHPARRRPEVGRMQRDDRVETGRLVMDEMERFVRVEIGEAPGGRHRCGRSMQDKKNGAIDGA